MESTRGGLAYYFAVPFENTIKLNNAKIKKMLSFNSCNYVISCSSLQ